MNELVLSNYNDLINDLYKNSLLIEKRHPNINSHWINMGFESTIINYMSSVVSDYRNGKLNSSLIVSLDTNMMFNFSKEFRLHSTFEYENLISIFTKVLPKPLLDDECNIVQKNIVTESNYSSMISLRAHIIRAINSILTLSNSYIHANQQNIMTILKFWIRSEKCILILDDSNEWLYDKFRHAIRDFQLEYCEDFNYTDQMDHDELVEHVTINNFRIPVYYINLESKNSFNFAICLDDSIEIEIPQNCIDYSIIDSNAVQINRRLNISKVDSSNIKSFIFDVVDPDINDLLQGRYYRMRGDNDAFNVDIMECDNE